jgi:hypothetical protein
MYARPADTLIAATAPGVASYTDPALGGELRLWITPTGQPAFLALNDGTGVEGSLEGTAYAIEVGGTAWPWVTLDLDARATTVALLTAPTGVTAEDVALPAVADEPALDACAAPGCWLWEPGAMRLRIRVPPTASGTQILVE